MHLNLLCSSVSNWKSVPFKTIEQNTPKSVKYHLIPPTSTRYHVCSMSHSLASLIKLCSILSIQLSIHEQPQSDAYILVMKGLSLQCFTKCNVVYDYIRGE